MVSLSFLGVGLDLNHVEGSVLFLLGGSKGSHRAIKVHFGRPYFKALPKPLLPSFV